jgi:hypothetical protein
MRGSILLLNMCIITVCAGHYVVVCALSYYDGVTGTFLLEVGGGRGGGFLYSTGIQIIV